MTEKEIEPSPTSVSVKPETGDLLSADMLARLARLTPRQKDCLRLVRPRYSSKMIAKDLGVSPLRVDAHVGDAMVTLGLNSRFEAGRFLRLWEQAEPGITLDSETGAHSEALPYSRDFRSTTAAVTDVVEMQLPTTQGTTASGGEGSADRRMARAPRVRTAPSFSSVAISIIAIAFAIGALTALLITFDWSGHG